MATIVNNPGGGERVIEREDSGVGWAVALVVLIAVIVGLFAWANYYRGNNNGANINVTIPNTGTGEGSGSTGGGSTGGGETGTGGSGSTTY